MLKAFFLKLNAFYTKFGRQFSDDVRSGPFLGTSSMMYFPSPSFLPSLPLSTLHTNANANAQPSIACASHCMSSCDVMMVMASFHGQMGTDGHWGLSSSDLHTIVRVCNSKPEPGDP